MEHRDEPMLKEDQNRDSYFTNTEDDTQERISRLMEQPFMVLSTQGNTQPYASLLAFHASRDLTQICFATSRSTRKFRLLEDCSRVAALVDNRRDSSKSFTELEAVTATGTAYMLEGDERAGAEKQLMGNHPYMADFIRSESTELFCIKVIRYFYVTRFQEVRIWIP
ncbi:MAG: pyridoxamine 5'-phosphate oxidase family protein [Fibrobacterota bacterium]